MKVDVGAVEAELARLQRELTNSEVRTSLFNLVVMSPDAQRAMVDEALNYLLGKRAARVIHIVTKPDATSSLEISARCFVDREHKGVCFEEIIITNGSDGQGGAPGTWIPLLVRDIPTYILWLDTISDKRGLFSHVQNQADKIIVDSDQSVELGEEPDALLPLLAGVAVSQGVPLADFSWKRLRPYRRLAAAAFDADDRLGLVNEIVSVHVRGLRPMAGHLLGLWFAERLGWTRAAAPERESGDAAGSAGAAAASDRYRDVRGRPVEVTVEPGEPGCNVAVSLRLASEHTVDIEAGTDGCADVEYPGGEEERTVTIPSNGEILLEEVDAVYADDFYRDALALLK
ncbi:MAG: glucose-6-phosphate dehydrogenase assembly protein OpcA [Spirochaetota bacterium]